MDGLWRPNTYGNIRRNLGTGSGMGFLSEMWFLFKGPGTSPAGAYTGADRLRDLLGPTAARLRVDFDVETLVMFGEIQPPAERRPEDAAFGLLHCGGQLLVANTYPDEFPASGRAASSGANALRQRLGEPQSVEASALLAQAQALLAAEQQRRVGDVGSASLHELCAKWLDSSFPLSSRTRNDLEADLDLIRRESARTAEFVDPDLDWIEFQQRANLTALRTALGQAFFESIADMLIRPGDTYESVVYAMAFAGGRWGSIEERRMRYVREALEHGFI
jgi:hypothetical protein